jgi:hypothetical protein
MATITRTDDGDLFVDISLTDISALAEVPVSLDRPGDCKIEYIRPQLTSFNRVYGIRLKLIPIRPAS